MTLLDILAPAKPPRSRRARLIRFGISKPLPQSSPARRRARARWYEKNRARLNEEKRRKYHARKTGDDV